MAERALTEEAMLAGLHDIRLPADAPGGVVAEILAAGGLGILAALVLAAAVVALTRLKPVNSARTDTNPVDTESGDDNARRLRLLHQLKTERPEAFAQLSSDLYRKGGLPEIAVLERMMKGHA